VSLTRIQIVFDTQAVLWTQTGQNLANNFVHRFAKESFQATAGRLVPIRHGKSR